MTGFSIVFLAGLDLLLVFVSDLPNLPRHEATWKPEIALKEFQQHRLRLLHSGLPFIFARLQARHFLSAFKDHLYDFYS